MDGVQYFCMENKRSPHASKTDLGFVSKIIFGIKSDS